jgi:hypothetical protein
VCPCVPGQQERLEEDEGCRPDRAGPAIGREQQPRDERLDKEGERSREEGDKDEKRGLGSRDRRGYSPITAQSRPIMMKKPLNSAISPRPP